MNKDNKQLVINSLAHLLVDGLCASTIFSCYASYQNTAIFIYNTLAFTGQCLCGLLIDKYKHIKSFLLISYILLLLAYFLPVNLYLKVILLGIGNSLFHVNGGYITLRTYKGMGPLGIFVAPGCLGLIIGSIYPKTALLFAIGIIFCLLLTNTFNFNFYSFYEDINSNHQQADVLLLLIAIASRAIGSCIVDYPWNNRIYTKIMIVLLVFLGKCFGGYLNEKYSIKKVSILSIMLSMILIIFFRNNLYLALLSQFALNLSMPVTLYLIYRLYPKNPGFAFGIAASALWPGTIIGKLLKASVYGSKLLIISTFIIGMLAIIVVERRIKNE